MNSEQIDKIKESIKNLRDKNSRIYFFVPPKTPKPHSIKYAEWKIWKHFK
jgi:hypothetical protein